MKYQDGLHILWYKIPDYRKDSVTYKTSIITNGHRLGALLQICIENQKLQVTPLTGTVLQSFQLTLGSNVTGKSKMKKSFNDS